MAEAAKCVFKQIACAVHSGSGLPLSRVGVILGDSPHVSKTVNTKLWACGCPGNRWAVSHGSWLEKVALFVWRHVYEGKLAISP